MYEYIHALTRDFSTLTRENCHGSSRPDSHETRISRVTRIVSGRVGSGQERFKTSRSGRVRRFSKSRGSGQVGSGGFQNLAGRVRSGQEVFKISRVGSGRVITSRNPRGSGRVASRRLEFSPVGSGQLARPDSTRPARCDPTRAKPCFFRIDLRLSCVCVVIDTTEGGRYKAVVRDKAVETA